MSDPTSSGAVAPPGAATVPPPSPAPAGPATAPPATAPQGPPRPRRWGWPLSQPRRVVTTRPGRLRVLSAVLCLLSLFSGALTAWQVSARSSAADRVVTQGGDLSAKAAEIYRLLADADAAVATGFLSGRQEPRELRAQFDDDVAEASRLLARTAAKTTESAPAAGEIRALNAKLPYYSAEVESARANNRQGLPLGVAYLRAANDTMRDELLPTAKRLYDVETRQLNEDYGDARAWPWAALALSVVSLVALCWCQVREFRRTNRVFNRGLLTASVCCAVTLVWMAAGHGAARSELGSSDRHGAASIRVLNEARIAALQARGDENLTLVARGAVVTKRGMDAYEEGHRQQIERLVGKRTASTGSAAAEPDSVLGRAAALADDEDGREPVAAATRKTHEWRERHRDVRSADQAGEHQRAVDLLLSDGHGPQGSFKAVDGALQRALKSERKEFTRAAEDGADAFTALVPGAVVLGLLAAGGAVVGVGRRLSEYQ